MSAERASLSIGLVAQLASKWFLSRVGSVVVFEVARLFEYYPAPLKFAFEDFPLSV